MPPRTRKYYRLTPEGRALWSRREQVALPPDYRRMLAVVEFCGYEEVIHSQLARYPVETVEGWLRSFENSNLIESTMASWPERLELAPNSALPPIEDEKERISADARFADISLSRLGAYVAHDRVVHRRPWLKPAQHTVALVVEDDPDQRALAVLRLSKAGYRVHSAESAAAMVGFLEQRAPDAIFLDVMLPDADGFDVLGTLRRHPAYARLPVIMVTAKTEAASIARGLELGADAYITKPYGANTLDYVLRYVLQQTLPEAAAVPAPPVPEKQVAAPPPPEDALRTRQDVRALLTEVQVRREGDAARSASAWRVVKRVALAVFLVFAVVQYYMMDTLYQIISVQPTPVFTPVLARDIKS